MVCTMPHVRGEGKRMLTNLFAGRFHKRCPLCKQEVHAQGSGAVRRFGRWYCSKLHADLYELGLYEALRSVHCHHAACHGEHVPLPEALGMHFFPEPCVEPVQVEDQERCAGVDAWDRFRAS
jgi:hypothetical protein